MSRPKKFILAGVAIVVLIFIAYLVIKSFGDSATPTPPADNGDGGVLPPGQAGVEPSQPEEKLVLSRLSDDNVSVFDFWIDPETNEIYYITIDGIVRAAKTGPDLDISTNVVSALNRVSLSPDGKQLLGAFGDPKSPNWGIFDVFDQVWRPLPATIINAAWENGDDLIVVVEDSGDFVLASTEVSAVISAGNGSFQYETLIQDFRLRDVVINISSKDSLLIAERPASFYAGRLWKLNLKTLELSLLFSPANGALVSWDSSDELLFRYTAPDKFAIYNEQLKSVYPVLFTTVPWKCDAAGIVYCFVPQEFPPGLGSTQLPDDYLQRRFFTIDNLYQISESVGDTELILRSGTGSNIDPLDAKNLRVSGDTLYFINRYDDGLYRLILQ